MLKGEKLGLRLKKFKHDLHYYRLCKKFKTMVTVFIVAIMLSILNIFFAAVINKTVEWINNLWLAVLSSACTLLIDLFWDLEQRRSEEFLCEIKKFGIEKLGYHKEKMVLECAEGCKEKLWISGYKLFLTRSIINDLMLKIGAEVDIRILISPPWMSGFKAAYGENEQVMNDYLFVFKKIINSNKGDVQIRFTNKPLFSDLYRLDDIIITGPYIHGKNGSIVTADEFFTYYVNDTTSDLFVRGEEEYNNLWDDASKILSIDKLTDFLNTDNNFYNELELRSKIDSLCEDRNQDGRH